MSLETRSGFVPDHTEFGLHIRSEIARKPALQVAKKIAKRANATAPYAEKKKGDRRRRHLKGSYTARPDGILKVGRNTRAIAVVESTVLEASTQEFGTKTQKANRPLLRAAIAVSIEEFGRFDGRSPGPEGFGAGS